MPSTSEKQRKFMAAVAHSPSFAKKVGVPMSVGKEFNQADKTRKLSRGGEMAESKAMMKKEVSFMKKKGAPKSMIKHEMKEAGMKKMAGGGMAASKMGAVKTAAPSRDGVAVKGKTKGTMVTMAKGGKAGVKKMTYGGKAC